MGSIDKACISGFLCRLCSEMHRTVIHIYGDQGQKHGLVEKINGYLPITISPTDPLPKTICEACLRRVEQHYELLLRLANYRENKITGKKELRPRLLRMRTVSVNRTEPDNATQTPADAPPSTSTATATAAPQPPPPANLATTSTSSSSLTTSNTSPNVYNTNASSSHPPPPPRRAQLDIASSPSTSSQSSTSDDDSESHSCSSDSNSRPKAGRTRATKASMATSKAKASRSTRMNVHRPYHNQQRPSRSAGSSGTSVQKRKD